MEKNRSRIKRLRKGLLEFVLWTVLLFISLPPVYAQPRSVMVVQVLGPLFSIDKGSEAGIRSSALFKAYRYESAAPPDRQWIFLGTAYAAQVFPSVSVFKFIEREPSATPAVSDVLALYPMKDSSEIIGETQLPKVIVREIPDKEIVRPREKPALQWNVSRKIGYPMGFGVQAITGYQNVPNYIIDNLETYLSNDIYIATPAITSETETAFGQSFTLQRYFPKRFSIRAEYGYIKFKGSLSSQLPEGAELPSSLPDNYLSKWDISLRSVLHIFSFTVLRGGTDRVMDKMMKKPNSSGFSYHWGTGIDYAHINYRVDTRTVLTHFNEELINNDFEKLPGRSHWGAHGIFGIDYTSDFGTFFIESGAAWWKTDGLKLSFPTRAGVIIYF